MMHGAARYDIVLWGDWFIPHLPPGPSFFFHHQKCSSTRFDGTLHPTPLVGPLSRNNVIVTWVSSRSIYNRHDVDAPLDSRIAPLSSYWSRKQSQGDELPSLRYSGGKPAPWLWKFSVWFAAIIRDDSDVKTSLMLGYPIRGRLSLLGFTRLQ